MRHIRAWCAGQLTQRARCVDQSSSFHTTTGSVIHVTNSRVLGIPILVGAHDHLFRIPRQPIGLYIGRLS